MSASQIIEVEDEGARKREKGRRREGKGCDKKQGGMKMMIGVSSGRREWCFAAEKCTSPISMDRNRSRHLLSIWQNGDDSPTQSSISSFSFIHSCNYSVHLTVPLQYFLGFRSKPCLHSIFVARLLAIAALLFGVCNPLCKVHRHLLRREQKQKGSKFLWAIMSAQRDPVDLNKQ